MKSPNKAFLDATSLSEMDAIGNIQMMNLR